MESIAIIGAGISGMTAAYYLSRRYRVTLFEENTRPGGHADTQDIMIDGKRFSVDTGFIVFNDRTYPNFIRLLNELDCRYEPTEMSFSVKHSARNLEYNGHNLNTLFAQRNNLLRPSFLGMIKDVLRFNMEAPSVCPDDTRSLGEYLCDNRYGERFQQDYLLPMAAAIWSAGSDAIKQFPVVALIRFFHHHGLIQLRDRPRWRVIRGGSRNYVDLMRARLKDVRTGSTVTRITRDDDHVTIESGGGKYNFDRVVIATHSDQALAMLA
ncbi:MAG: FAD-dependent oxidoreductase, partial [Pseudomonadales bacterium]|nr:FAD-dependent oxidoreductase [Pseudomonadales bacterium]